MLLFCRRAFEEQDVRSNGTAGLFRQPFTMQLYCSGPPRHRRSLSIATTTTAPRSSGDRTIVSSSSCRAHCGVQLCHVAHSVTLWLPPLPRCLQRERASDPFHLRQHCQQRCLACVTGQALQCLHFAAMQFSPPSPFPQPCTRLPASRPNSPHLSSRKCYYQGWTRQVHRRVATSVVKPRHVRNVCMAGALMCGVLS